MGRVMRREGRRRSRALLLSLLASVLAGGCGFQEPALQPITREPITRVEIPPIHNRTAVMDVMVVDPSTRTLYVADATDPTTFGIDVIDISTSPGRYVKTIRTGDSFPNGLVIAPDVKRLYTGNDDSTVRVVDLDPASPGYQTIVGSIGTGGRLASDLIDYDTRDHKVYVANPDDGYLTAIDSRTNRIVGRVDGLGLIAQPRYDSADGMLYVGAVDDNQLIQIDPRTDRVVQRRSLDVPCVPHGIAINPTTNQGIIGCADKDQPVTIAWDFTRFQPIRTFDLAGAGDLVVYEPSTDHFYFAASSYAPAEMAIFSGTPINYLTSVPTSHKSHVVAYDSVHRLIYTYDGRLREAALWVFPDPTAFCDAQLKHCRAS
jgi:DNA-binding beta-propeller fold protein YncE